MRTGMADSAASPGAGKNRWAVPGSVHDRLVRWAKVLLPSAVGALIAILAVAPLGKKNDVSFILDKKKVHPFFIEFIIYHEMLHADIGVRESKGRRTVHCREFRRREKIFKKYSEAIAWEKEMNFLL